MFAGFDLFLLGGEIVAIAIGLTQPGAIMFTVIWRLARSRAVASVRFTIAVRSGE